MSQDCVPCYCFLCSVAMKLEKQGKDRLGRDKQGLKLRFSKDAPFIPGAHGKGQG